jgi:glycine oxidase
MSARADVAVVGGGVIGCAVAREFARRGRRVVLLERGIPGGEASGVAAGLLSPQADGSEPGPFLDLCLESRALYPDWVRAIEAESGRAVSFRRTGILRCARSVEEESRLERTIRWQRAAGLPLREVDASEAAALSGSPLFPELRRALFFPEDGIVDAGRLTEAAAESARAAGVDLRLRTPVRSFRIEAGRCRGIETDSGSLAADLTVDAAGAWAAFPGELPLDLPVSPVKGQLAVARLPGPPPDTVVENEEVYLVPWREGRILAGATVEHAGFDKTVTPQAMSGLMEAAARLLPAAESARFEQGRAGLRPGTPDGRPLLGPTRIDGFWLATGHFRNGILLAPVTARLLADAADGARAPELAPFLADRFAGRERVAAERFG